MQALERHDFTPGRVVGRRQRRAGILLALLAVLGGQAVAETPAPDPQFAEIVLAGRLLALGHERRDPLLILAAARLRQGQAFERGERGEIVETGDVLPFLLGSDPGDTASLFDEARYLAKDDAALLALIDDIEAEGARGLITGQEFVVGTLAAGASDTHIGLTFEGGTYAEVYVENGEGHNLDLIVRDETGAVVCEDKDPSSVAYCGWTPARTGAFDVEVKNASGAHAGYALMTN